MADVLVDRNSGEVLGTAPFLIDAPDDSGAFVVRGVPDAEVQEALSQPGIKTWNSETEDIEVVPPTISAEDLKNDRKVELANEAVANIAQQLTLPTELSNFPNVGDREIMMRLALAVVKISEGAGLEVDPALKTVADMGSAVVDAVKKLARVDTTHPDAPEQIQEVTLLPETREDGS